MALVKGSHTPLQNVDALEFFRPLEEANIGEIAYAGLMDGGRRPFIIMKKTNGLVEILPNDPLQRYYMLKWAHGNPKERIEIEEISMRLVCANGMLGTDSHSIRLDYKVGAREALHDMSKLITESDSMMVNSEEYLRRMTRYPFSSKEEVENFFRRSIGVPWRDPDLIIEDEIAFEKSLKRGSKVVERLFELFDQENKTGPDENKDSLYVGFNAVTNLTSNHRGRRGGRNRFQQNWYGSGKTIRKRSFGIAKEMVTAEA